ncbi:uncharacterized protein LOC119632416 [Glossina fuscipes]|uniref:Uncharacterized protein LOC119632416 n=1 Tax=Glossina fuscipes TaxID=7396 RepID=A0A8U0W7W2_9MUSC|nr:uncharacterized protein LOC119632416 [Glossina fuscipes]KAI9587328.1 hypothetical protein GQX74_003174 [Glossina fuscipes]
MITGEDLKVKRNVYKYSRTEKQSQSDLSPKCSAESIDVESVTSKILIIPGLGETSERNVPFACMNETMNDRENCDSEHIINFAEMKAPSWIAEGYETINLSEAERIIKEWGNRPPESFTKFSNINNKKHENMVKILGGTESAKHCAKRFEWKRQSRYKNIQPNQNDICRRIKIPSEKEETRDFPCHHALKPIKRMLFEDESRESLRSCLLSKQTPSCCSYTKKPVTISPIGQSKCNCDLTNRLACPQPNVTTSVCETKPEESRCDTQRYNCRPLRSNCCHCEVIYKTSTQTNRTAQSKMCHCNFDDEKPTTSKGIKSERPDICLPSIESNPSEKLKGSKQDLIDNIMRKLLGCDNSEINIEIKKSKKRNFAPSLNDRAAIIAKESISCQTEFTSLTRDPDSRRTQKQTTSVNSSKSQQEPYEYHRDDGLTQCRSRCQYGKKATRNKDISTYTHFHDAQINCLENSKEISKVTRKNSVESWLRNNPSHLEYPRINDEASGSSFHNSTESNDFLRNSLSDSNFSEYQTSVAPSCGAAFPLANQIPNKERNLNSKAFLRNSTNASNESGQSLVEDTLSVTEDPIDFSVGGQNVSFFNDLQNGPTLKIPRFALNLHEKHHNNQLIDASFDYIGSEQSEYSKGNHASFKASPDADQEPNSLYFLRTNHCLFSPKSTFDQCLHSTEPYVGYSHSDSKCYE